MAFVAELGATGINYRTEDFEARLLELTAHGADVIVDFVGASYAESTRVVWLWAAVTSCVGLLGGQQGDGRLRAPAPLRRQALLGLVMRSRPLADKIAIVEAFRRRFLPLFSDARLRALVDVTLPLAEVVRAHERMEANQNLGRSCWSGTAGASARG